MILKQAAPGHRSRSSGQDSIFFLDSNSGECLHYESSPSFPLKKRFAMEADLISPAHPTVQINNNLIDCQIDICSLEVLLLYTENFDYQSPRQDFLRGVLESDILNKHIYTHIIEA